jgi:hypothetical protein
MLYTFFLMASLLILAQTIIESSVRGWQTTIVAQLVQSASQGLNRLASYLRPHDVSRSDRRDGPIRQMREAFAALSAHSQLIRELAQAVRAMFSDRDR